MLISYFHIVLLTLRASLLAHLWFTFDSHFSNEYWLMICVSIFTMLARVGKNRFKKSDFLFKSDFFI